MVPTLIFTVIILSLVLIKSADMVVVALRRLAKTTHTGVFVLSAFLLAIGTSFPEFFVAVTSALEGSPTLSFGNVLGANVANISLVAGVSAALIGKVNVTGDYLKRDIIVAFFAGLLPFVLCVDGEISKVDGLILLAAYGAYTTSLFKGRFLQIAEAQSKESFIYRFLRQFNHSQERLTKEMGRLFIGIALLLASSDLIVRVARELAERGGIPVFLVGLVILSIGTTLPELVFSLRSVRDHEPTMFFGNILGSIIANSTLVLGTAAFITPIKIIAINESIRAAAAFVVIFFCFWLFTKSKQTLDRKEGIFLVVLYIGFIVLLFL